MLLSPRYDGPPILSIEGAPDGVLAPMVRQRKRFAATLAELPADDWSSPSRCGGWSVQDVVAHLVGVNTFWQGSVIAGLDGAPTRYLSAFDPAATPPMMVDGMRSLSSTEALDLFVTSNDDFLATVADLDDAGWASVAESPAGHVSIRMLSAHALWDCWVHERDVALPLGITPAEEADEVLVCLRYAAALSPAFAISTGTADPGTYAVEVSQPDLRFVIEVADSVHVRDGSAPAGTACLRGSAVELVEVLSMRSPLPASAPAEWRDLLGGLATVFDAEVQIEITSPDIS